MRSCLPHVLPGPYKWEVLQRRTQRTHISQTAWNEDKVRGLKTRLGKLQGDPVMVIFQTLWLPTSHRPISYMWHICVIFSALVERWRPETYTFHMTQGEMMITLQDVVGIHGLPTDGQVVTGHTALDWFAECEQVFSHAPIAGEDIFDGDLRISYLDKL
ncbi:protein MAIN-LIKE 2-like [Gastrolobium bilobum]|uniref:protein MAIN-LIKE 2-like n=1 Tax=Gastrolobium bilobum TaxID=150636 RepID=UPI002AAFC3CA|nr:protein MAIN-LIKE 2-like [Gastrolobium bilobum]